ncbi:MAG TPA: thymidine phosphorylase [Firmicutes bacterium]|uniref:Thymidine phosphorylase n=1 Tax=candidate division TA06 bacterium TaxID=2250710 RepID=A0A660SBA5_UNCT6|nr:MAG: thymidine phosphorylase [candidate division TA06 bacterium]HFD05027.1 thymidine phosphorylase [Bacillota bacterium]
MIDIIRKKRNGETLTPEEIDFVINGFVNNTIPDYQVSALLMAIYFNGMNDEETTRFTTTMMNSGDIVNLSDIAGFKVDKHSTGGVGDKISIPLAPLVASAGVTVPMVSGRGLGHTGGTLDKLESIPGMRTNLKIEEFTNQLHRIGVAIMGQTAEMNPADKKMYALRDVTATVESIPLITASIMSKKMAEGIDGLVLDVKFGNGAFMKTVNNARILAEKMVNIGSSMNKQVTAFITNMNQPLGEKIGNALEIKESIDILKGKGPEDVKELVLQLGAEMLVLGKVASTTEEALKILKSKIANGEALKKFTSMIEMQGGNPAIIDNDALLPHTPYILQVQAERDGFITEIDTFGIGNFIVHLGGGRKTINDTIDYAVGVEIFKKLGMRVDKGDTLANIHINNIEEGERLETMFRQYIKIGDEAVNSSPLIEDIIK